jgi:hypothetical protein
LLLKWLVDDAWLCLWLTGLQACSTHMCWHNQHAPNLPLSVTWCLSCYLAAECCWKLEQSNQHTQFCMHSFCSPVQIPSALARRVRAFFNYESTKLIRGDEEGLLQVCVSRCREGTWALILSLLAWLESSIHAFTQ